MDKSHLKIRQAEILSGIASAVFSPKEDEFHSEEEAEERNGERVMTESIPHFIDELTDKCFRCGRERPWDGEDEVCVRVPPRVTDEDFEALRQLEKRLKQAGKETDELRKELEL